MNLLLLFCFDCNRPQAAVVITVFFLKNEMALRKNCLNPLMTSLEEDESLLAPLGNSECFDV